MVMTWGRFIGMGVDGPRSGSDCGSTLWRLGDRLHSFCRLNMGMDHKKATVERRSDKPPILRTVETQTKLVYKPH